ncbi:MAG TPA: 3-phosphoserine/phosphohydroxythreonine transaminase [Actinomycetota bacterium]|nr:3-phosphoserine/phosphohydroxythreonine transaminase [Actinomycetota bacterium]
MRLHNFCAGPCTLPLEVLEEAQAELLDYRGSGMSVIEMSHRSPEYEAIHEDALERFRSAFLVPDDFTILFLQGGATLQFAIVPMNLLRGGTSAGYVRSGTWGKGALKDAGLVGDAYTAWDGEGFSFTRMPADDELEIRAGSRYLHVTSNETIEGIRMPSFPTLDVPLVADMSSDYLSRPIPWQRFDLVYGGAQKNLGPAGLAVVIVRTSVLGETRQDLPSYLRLSAHADKDSLLNTPAMFSIWVMGKVLAWIQELGGVEAMAERAARRSGSVYEAIDASEGFYRSPVEVAHRSHMNVVFRTPSGDLDAAFLKEAEQEGLVNLKGHRSVGGIRASIYNAMTDDGVEALVAFMRAFRDANT